MRFTLSLVMASIASTSLALVARQTVPDCALTCISKAPTGDCAPNDNKCLCENPAFIGSVETCDQTTCSAADQAAAQEFVNAMCAAVGVASPGQ